MGRGAGARFRVHPLGKRKKEKHSDGLEEKLHFSPEQIINYNVVFLHLSKQRMTVLVQGQILRKEFESGVSILHHFRLIKPNARKLW